MINYILKKIIGTQNERAIHPLRAIVEKINSFEPEYEKFSAEQLKDKTKEVVMKFTVPVIMIIAGVVIAAVAALTIVSKHPIVILFMAIGVGLYLLGKKLKPKA